jgi:hypothetical protein
MLKHHISAAFSQHHSTTSPHHSIFAAFSQHFRSILTSRIFLRIKTPYLSTTFLQHFRSIFTAPQHHSTTSQHYHSIFAAFSQHSEVKDFPAY